jgi:4-hydroxybenzoate polyprenyltransferase
MSLIKELRHFPDFIKLSHSVFALPFVLAALVLASNGFPNIRTLVLVIAAVVTARTTAMAFNRLVDQKFDAANPRTAERHLVSGKISKSTASIIVGIGAVVFVLLAISINRLAGLLSPIVIVVILGYSFTKRFTSFSHFFLGAALGLAPIGAWVAVRADLGDWVPWLIGLAVMLWVAGFDLIYAMQDVEFDRSAGLHSMVVLLGEKSCLQWVGILHALMLLILVGVGLLLKMHWPYFLGMSLVVISLIWEQWLMRKSDGPNTQLAFLQANALASFGYLGAVVLGVMW